MHDARVAAANIMAVYAVVVDALTRRLLELAVDELGEPAAPFAWLALGSQARREAIPSSDIDSAIVWFGDTDEAEIRPLAARARRAASSTGSRRCGLTPRQPRRVGLERRCSSARSRPGSTRRTAGSPTRRRSKALILVVGARRQPAGVGRAHRHAGRGHVQARARATPRCCACSRASRSPTGRRPGFLRGLVVEHGGEHRGRLDLKHGGVIPIVDLARWAGMAAGVTSASTTERLRAAAAAGTLPAADAHTLAGRVRPDLAGCGWRTRSRQLRAGAEPDDYVDPAALSPLTRSHLKEAFRAVASIQKRVTAELNVGVL